MLLRAPNHVLLLLVLDFLRACTDRHVPTDSSTLYFDGDRQIIKVVRELPPIASWSIRVSFESRKGMCLIFGSVIALITCPSADSDLLIDLASSICCPFAPVFFAVSDPARSHRVILEVLSEPVSRFFCSTSTMNTACDRLEPSFIPVDPRRGSSRPAPSRPSPRRRRSSTPP